MANTIDLPTYENTGFEFKNSTIGDIIGGKTGLVAYVYVIAGIILLIMLITGGISLMTSAGDPDKVKAGYGKITHALIGFLIVFASYLIVKVVEVVLGVSVL